MIIWLHVWVSECWICLLAWGSLGQMHGIPVLWKVWVRKSETESRQIEGWGIIQVPLKLLSDCDFKCTDALLTHFTKFGSWDYGVRVKILKYRHSNTTFAVHLLLLLQLFIESLRLETWISELNSKHQSDRSNSRMNHSVWFAKRKNLSQGRYQFNMKTRLWGIDLKSLRHAHGMFTTYNFQNCFMFFFVYFGKTLCQLNNC